MDEVLILELLEDARQMLARRDNRTRELRISEGERDAKRPRRGRLMFGSDNLADQPEQAISGRERTQSPNLREAIKQLLGVNVMNVR
jgi:hypothetical protein